LLTLTLVYVLDLSVYVRTMIANPNPSVRTWRHCLSGETRGKEESIVDRKHP